MRSIPGGGPFLRMPETKHIAADDDGIRLDRWFKRHYPGVTHVLLEKLLRKGEVRLDGKRVKSSDRVEKGQIVRLPPQVIYADKDAPQKPAPKPRPEDSALLQDMILYMDKAVIVLNKPSGLATQGGSGLSRHVDGMLDSIAFEKKQRPRLVHRLDRDTSGVLVIARTPTAAAALSRALAERDASKIYWAMTRGVPKEKSGSINVALAKEGGFGTHGQDERMTPSMSDEAKHAVTDYVVLGHAGDEYAWVAAKPVTGRTHQIRVHLASLGTPIVADFKYGGTDARPRGQIDDRLHLHARSIDIAHPEGGRLKVTAPLPPHMLKSWELFGFDVDDTRDPFAARKKKRK